MNNLSWYLCIAASVLLNIFLLIKYLQWRITTNKKIKTAIQDWLRLDGEKQINEEVNRKCEEWKHYYEKKVRKDAVNRSTAVIKGKVTEHLVPYFPEFNYHPSDARFLGTPIDFIVFDGLSEGQLKEIVFVEVKSGRNINLNSREKQVQASVIKKNIKHVIMRVG